ncbi:hypothetical protein CEXT_15861 [Caerostris extrusa]|uniref:Uncharacterized protein n=1 Tax=Caerostris extrusa TaxID=172846 RepID=A0AAV4XN29_CAEEX|nr:hypothetical protein CEXT_15861 [Caerostris extrusa]
MFTCMAERCGGRVCTSLSGTLSPLACLIWLTEKVESSSLHSSPGPEMALTTGFSVFKVMLSPLTSHFDMSFASEIRYLERKKPGEG